MRKGISPIVSSVLLLAVTLSVASIFSGWGPNLVKSVTQTTTNQTETTINCNQASVEIVSARYYTAGETAIVVRNTGTSELKNLQISAWQNSLPVSQQTISISEGNFTTENVSTPSKPDTIKAFSKDCSSVRDDFEQIE
ncbi:MAG: archaellin/type IV pilin N-terminal domain-containing protein [Candidatus Nanohaloarchaea archaeon]